jgi:hypothetical protein
VAELTWANTYISDVADIGTALATDGQTVGIEVGGSFAGLGQQLTSGNGATMDIVAGGSFDGAENAVRIYPPTATVGGEGQYACWLRFLDLTDGVNDIGQMNFRTLVYYGPRYFDLAPDAKCWGFQCTTVIGDSQNHRLAVFDHRQPVWNNWKYPYQTVTTTPNFHEPPTSGSIDSGPDANKLIEIRGSANHAAGPPQTGGEWLCFEQMIDLRQDRGNANGRHKVRVTTRDGVVVRTLSVPLNWEPSWDFDAQYAGQFEGLGFYFNTVGTANVGNYVMYSHATFAANLGINDWIGPPPGFLEGEDDTTPNAFSFTDQTSVALSSTITSASITVSGIDAAATITVSGGSYDINGSGTFVTSSGTVNNGDTVRARHTSSASYSTATNTVVTIGGVSDTFTSTTESDPEDDTTPNAFSFTDQTDVALSTVITSAAITVSGIDAPATISVTGGTYDINASGTFVGTSGTVSNGDTVRARHTSSSSNSTATNTVVTIGGVSDTFTSTTEAAEPGEDTTPNAFTFTDQTDVARSTVITSAAITVAGIDAPATISVTGGTYDINGSGTFVSTPGTVEVGDTVRARHTSSASYETATNTVITIGGVSDTFTSTTEESEIIIPAHRWFRVPRR